jgi:hypothetical protein
MKVKLLLASIAALLTVKGINKYRHRNANWLRNDEGVGPAHYPGTNRGNERVYKKGTVSDDADDPDAPGGRIRPKTSGEEGSHAAGRVLGSVRPS